MNNMFNDDITTSIASTVRDVLEGKPAVIKEEVKYPHDMFHPKTGEKEVANNEEEHKALDAKGYTHKKNEVAQPQKPSGKLGQDSGEKDFADKHKGKKVGEKEDGTVVKEATISVSEKLKKSGKDTLDVDYIGDDRLTKELEKKFKVKIKSTGNTTADITGDRKNIINLLKSDAYLMDEDEIEDTFPSLAEEVQPEEDEAKLKESEKQAAYQKVFKAGLKKFGASGIGDMDDAKKKEFFNWVDKNYKSKAEEIKAKGKDEEDVNEAMSQKDMEKRLKLIKKAVEKINRQNLRNAKADAMKMMKQSGMFDEDASDEEEVDELTDKQKKLPAGLQKAIKAKEKEEVKEDVRDMKNYKDRDRKGHEAYMSIQVVKGNTSNKFDDDFGFSKAEMVMMDKLISKIKNMHVSSFDGGSSGPASLEFYGDEASLKKFIADKNVQKIVKKYKGKVSGPNKA